jgi:hypothetical protein
VTERYGSARLTSSWPRAAWFLAEQGRWGLKQVSRTACLQGPWTCTLVVNLPRTCDGSWILCL